jgi:Skp family chaperone for outer membrane proteins
VALRSGFAALIGIVLVSLSGPALSQLAVSEGESATPPPALSEQFSAPRMALIDLEGVLRASNGTLRVRELLDEQRLLFQAEFAEREAGLQQAERRLQTARDSISEEEFSDRLSAFEDEVALIQREIQYRREALDLAFQDAQARLRQIAIEIVADIAREQKLDLVLKEDSTMVFRPGLNISEEVLRRLDERTKDARIEIEVDNGTDSTLGADQ